MKIGIDLGGTNMRIGVVDGDKIQEKEIIPCPAQEPEQAVVNALVSLIAKHINPDVTGIGVGVPTLVDAEKGIVYNATNIPSWKEVHLKDILQKHFNIPVEVNNDANCFALGEKRFGAGRDAHSLVGLTLGTGVGSGLVLDDKLYCGRNTGAGEVGELPFRDSNFEAYCSSGFFVRQYGTTGKDAAIAARGGDDKAIGIWNDFGSNVGKLIKAVMFAYDPDSIVIGGGIANAFDLYKGAMMAEVASFPYQASVENISISTSKLADVAILGASALV